MTELESELNDASRWALELEVRLSQSQESLKVAEGKLAIALEALIQLRDIVNGAIEREDYILPVQLVSVNTVLKKIQSQEKP